MLPLTERRKCEVTAFTPISNQQFLTIIKSTFAVLTSHSTHSKAELLLFSSMNWARSSSSASTTSSLLPRNLHQKFLWASRDALISFTYLKSCCHLTTRKPRFQLTYKWVVTTNLKREFMMRPSKYRWNGVQWMSCNIALIREERNLTSR